ncbi:MAG TPA: hypothetical protein GX702_13765 [Chloroflexi bacterium]|jgi:hypothetical protein|nr:hypothetical protein [Chloroflexota bacterium]
MITRPIYRLLFTLMLLTGILLSAHPALAQMSSPAPVPLPPVPQDDPFFGVVQAIHDPQKAIPMGVSWERLVLWWSNIQPNDPDDWDPNGWFARSALEDQISWGINPVGVVLHTPKWAGDPEKYPPNSPPRNLDLPFDDPENYWGQFMTRLAAEYAGLVDTWIIWNEPEYSWAGTVDEFVRLQVVGYQAVKKGNPNATVVLTGTTWWFDIEQGRTPLFERILEGLVQAEGAEEHGAYFDAVAVHQYRNPLNSYTVPMLYRRLLQKHDLDKPLWLVEANTVPYDDPVFPLMRGGLRATMDEQASYIIQSIALARAAGIERYSIYKMRDEEPENDELYGLVRNDGSIRPAYAAYQVAASELSHVTDAQYFWSGSATPPTENEITALLASSKHYPQFVWPGALNGVRMRRGDDRVTVLWNATAEPLEVGVPSGAAKATLVDKFGQRQTLTRSADGAYYLTLAPATNNTDVRDPSLTLVGGDPVILIEPGMATSRDPYPRPVDAAWGVPGALVPMMPTPQEAWVAPTGYAVSGPWLEFYRAHGGEDYFGYPRSPVVVDPDDPEQVVQYFQRVVLEWHPDNPPAYRIQRRLLSMELMSPEPAPAVQPAEANSRDYWYFPKGERGLGHAVTNRAPDGTWIGFKDYFDRYGREDAFGYPMEPPTRRVGEDGVERWTQRFQAAFFEYHPEFDRDGLKPGTGIPWRNWRVQLRLLGDEYLRVQKLPFVSGDPAEHVGRPPGPTPE